MLGVFGIMKLAKITGSAILMTSTFPEILLTPEFGVTCYGISKVQGRHFKRFHIYIYIKGKFATMIYYGLVMQASQPFFETIVMKICARSVCTIIRKTNIIRVSEQFDMSWSS